MSNLTNAPDEKDRRELDGYIRPLVYNVLSTISNNSTAVMNDNVDLKYNLFLTPFHLRNLRRPFQEIISSIHPSATISAEECERLSRVRDCIELIKFKVTIKEIEFENMY